MKKNKIVPVIMTFVLLGTTACSNKKYDIFLNSNDSSSNIITETTAVTDTEQISDTTDNTEVVDMTVRDENSEYGVIYYTPSDEQHIAKSDDHFSEYVDNEILIVANESATRDDITALAEKYDAEIVGEIEITGDYQLKLNKVCTMDELDALAKTLESDALIDLAYPNYVTEISAESLTATPPEGLNYGDKWRKDVEKYNGKGLSWGWEAIHTNEAWEYLSQNEDKVNKDLRIGLIDSGFYIASQMDLEFAATFYDNGNNNENQTNEERTHGTHVAGTMAAISDNEKGICGVYPYGRGHLYGVRAPSYGAVKHEENKVGLIAFKIALAELIIRNVKVINHSMGWGPQLIAQIEYGNNEKVSSRLIAEYSGLSDVIGDYLQRFIDKGYDFVIVNSSGNTSNDKWTVDDDDAKEYDITAKTVHTKWVTTQYNSVFTGVDKEQYPDVFDRIIVVGSVNENLELSKFSNIGERVDVFAPGEEIYSTVPQVKYAKYKGTSMASPHVAGVAAMVWAANSSLTGADVKRIVCESGKKAVEYGFTFGIPKQLNPDPANERAYFVNAAAAVDMSLHSFNVWAEGYEPETKPENGAILCWVVDATNEDIKLEGATIEAVDENDKTKVYKTTSDEVGHFELILPEGKYTLTVRYNRYEDYVKTGVEVTDEGVNYLDDWIKMKPFTDFTTFQGRYYLYTKAGCEEIDLDDTGCFTGQYNLDNGWASTPTVIQSEFNGIFSSPTKIDEYTYSFTVESGKSAYGNETVTEDGVTYDRKESDIKVGSEFRIYTKDAPDSILPRSVIDLRDSAKNGTFVVVINLDYSYILYDVANDTPYFSESSTDS